jgi:hypothetical protein
VSGISVFDFCLVFETDFLLARFIRKERCSGDSKFASAVVKDQCASHREATESPPIASRASGSTPGPPTPLGKSVEEYRRAIQACTLTFGNDPVERAVLDERNPRRWVLLRSQEETGLAAQSG